MTKTYLFLPGVMPAIMGSAYVSGRDFYKPVKHKTMEYLIVTLIIILLCITAHTRQDKNTY